MNKIQKLMRVLLTIVIFTPVFANPQLRLNEADTLKRVVLELNAITPLIQEAQRRSDQQDRLRFDYRCLINDLGILKSGLNAAISAIRDQYSRSLCGDYGYSGKLGGESTSLSMLVNELQSLIPIIREAQGKTDNSLRAKMNYPALLGDLDEIISGIQTALIGAGDQPRSFSALRGGFSQ